MSDTDGHPGDSRVRPEIAWAPRFVLSVIFVFAACLIGLNGPDRVEDAEVQVDGTSQTVAVASYRSTVLLADEGVTEPSCTVTDPETGVPLPFAPPGRSNERSGGKIGDFVAFQAFTPATDTVEIACEAAPGGGSPEAIVLVSPENASTPYLVVRYGGALVLLLVGLGLAAHTATYVLRRRG